jgi:hypothetical protein
MTEEPREKEPRKRVAVRVIGARGESALVEWDGKRGYVPAKMVKDGTVSPTALDKAVPYGVPWENLDKGLAAELRAAGIWTKGDLSHNQNLAWRIAMPFKIGVADLNRFAHKEG